jgi:peptidoglycan-associated lipoprotein
MWSVGYVKLAAISKPAAFAACFFLTAACAENRPAPVAEISPTSTVPLGTTQDFFLNVGDRVFFSENSAELSPIATATLNKQVEWLVKYPNYRVTVEGHTDEKGDKKKNLKLADQRAQAVRGYLTTRGVAGNRIRIVSYGRDKRVATCNEISCWSQNRRVVTVLDTAAEPAVASRPAPGPARLPTYAAPRG